MPLDTDKNAFWANLETRSEADQWDGPEQGFPTDEFQFHDAARGATEHATLVSEVLHAALDSRDITITDSEEAGAFKSAASLLQAVFESDIETRTDVAGLLGDELNVTFVDDFATTDGTALNGAAILGSDEVIIDSALTGEELRDTLIEEIAETAYQQAYDSTSPGDFGAELLARLKGEDSEEALAEYSKDTEADTVETEFGTAEAMNDDDLAQFVKNIEDANAGIDIYGAQFFDRATYDKYYDASGAGSDDTLEKTFWGDEFLDALTLGGGGFDFNDDGTPSYSYYGFLNAADEPKGEVVSRASEYEYTPIQGLSDEFRYDGVTPGQLRIGWSYEENQTFTIAEEINYSESVEVDGQIGFKVANLEYSGGVSNTKVSGGSITESNTWSATTSANETYVADVENYPSDVPIYYGEHTVVADVNMQTRYDLWLMAVDENGYLDGIIQLDVSDTRVVEDYLVSIAKAYTTGDGLVLDENIANSLGIDFGFV